MDIGGSLVDPRARMLVSVVSRIKHEAALRLLLWMLEAEQDLAVDVTVNEVAERLECSKVYAHRMMTVLCDLGLVCPESSVRRGRSRSVWLLAPAMFLRRGSMDAAGVQRVKQRFEDSIAEMRRKADEKTAKAIRDNTTPEPIVVPNEEVRELEAAKLKTIKRVNNAKSKVG